MQSNDDFNDFEKHWKYLHRFYISLFSRNYFIHRSFFKTIISLRKKNLFLLFNK